MKKDITLNSGDNNGCGKVFAKKGRMIRQASELQPGARKSVALLNICVTVTLSLFPRPA